MTAGENPIRVMVVDDHDVVRTGLRALFSDEAGIEFAARPRTRRTPSAAPPRSGRTSS